MTATKKKKKTLTIYSTYEPEVVARITNDGQGNNTVLFSSDLLRPTIDRWLKYGIIEWVGVGVEAEQRHTPPSDPEFLTRLLEYIKKESNLDVRLQ